LAKGQLHADGRIVRRDPGRDVLPRFVKRRKAFGSAVVFVAIGLVAVGLHTFSTRLIQVPTFGQHVDVRGLIQLFSVVETLGAIFKCAGAIAVLAYRPGGRLFEVRRPAEGPQSHS